MGVDSKMETITVTLDSSAQMEAILATVPAGELWYIEAVHFENGPMANDVASVAIIPDEVTYSTSSVATDTPVHPRQVAGSLFNGASTETMGWYAADGARIVFGYSGSNDGDQPITLSARRVV